MIKNCAAGVVQFFFFLILMGELEVRKLFEFLFPIPNEITHLMDYHANLGY